MKWLLNMIVLEETGVSAGDGSGVGVGEWDDGGGVDPDCVHVEVTDRSPQRCTPGSNR